MMMGAYSEGSKAGFAKRFLAISYLIYQ